MTLTLAWMLLNQSQSHVQQDDVKQQHDLSQSPLREYCVTLSSGEELYILAADLKDAAYDALELSKDTNTQLIDVRQSNEW